MARVLTASEPRKAPKGISGQVDCADVVAGLELVDGEANAGELDGGDVYAAARGGRGVAEVDPQVGELGALRDGEHERLAGGR